MARKYSLEVVMWQVGYFPCLQQTNVKGMFGKIRICRPSKKLRRMPEGLPVGVCAPPTFSTQFKTPNVNYPQSKIPKHVGRKTTPIPRSCRFWFRYLGNLSTQADLTRSGCSGSWDLGGYFQNW